MILLLISATRYMPTPSLLRYQAPLAFWIVVLFSPLLWQNQVHANTGNPPTLNGQAKSDRRAQISDVELRHFLQNSLDNPAAELDKYQAEVWLESMLSRMAVYKVDKKEALAILKAVYREAKASDLEPDLVLAVIAIESSFDRFAISVAGAQGLMQVMPFWKDELGRPLDNLMDIDTNIRYGCKILQYYLQKSRGRLSDALARYNGSFGRTSYPEKVLVNWQERWQSGRVATSN